MGRQNVCIFTDGSTWAGVNYSGVGIYVTCDSKSLLQYGFAVLSNGDNFHAEVAGVTVAAWAAVDTLSCTIYTDSLATIEAVKAPRSDRAWGRTPSRGWIKRLHHLLVKHPHIQLQFVKGHTGNQDWYSKGNQMADTLAKKANAPTTDGITLDDGGVYLTLNGRLNFSGIKEEINQVMRAQRQEALHKLHQQSATISAFPTQYTRVAADIRAGCVSRDKESLWSFFVLATLRWILPPPAAGPSPFCNLCHSYSIASIDHYMECKALDKFHRQMELSVHGALRSIGVPLPLIKESTDWASKNFLCDPSIKGRIKEWGVSGRHLRILARRYLRRIWPQIPIPSEFALRVNQLVADVKCNCQKTHVCELKNCWTTPPDLLSIMAQEFNLQVEGCADPLHLTNVLPRYVSATAEHGFFGAEHDVLTANLSGVNTYLNPPFTGRRGNNNQHFISILIQKWATMVKAEKPTRAVMLIPEPTAGDGHVFLQEALKAGGRQFFSIERNQSCFWSALAYKVENPDTWGVYTGRVHFVLFQNVAAEILSPISGETLNQRLGQWAAARKVVHTFHPIMFKSQSKESEWAEVPEDYSILRLYGRTPPSNDQVDFHVRKKSMRKWIQDINTKADRLAMMAGFIPKSLHYMIRHFRPTSYREDENLLRLKILEANEKTYHVYCRMKSRWDKMTKFLEKEDSRKEKKISKTSKIYPTTAKPKIKESKTKKSTNIHAEHQDRKRKRKLT